MLISMYTCIILHVKLRVKYMDELVLYGQERIVTSLIQSIL